MNRGSDYDSQGNYSMALDSYRKGLDFFSAAVKYEKSERIRETLKAKMADYLERAEAIKQHLTKSEKKLAYYVM